MKEGRLVPVSRSLLKRRPEERKGDQQLPRTWTRSVRRQLTASESCPALGLTRLASTALLCSLSFAESTPALGLALETPRVELWMGGGGGEHEKCETREERSFFRSNACVA